MNRKIFIFFCVFVFIFSSVYTRAFAAAAARAPIVTYADVPGITDEEKSAVEALRERRPQLVYGQMAGTESFIQSDGTIAGFAADFCEL